MLRVVYTELIFVLISDENDNHFRVVMELLSHLTNNHLTDVSQQVNNSIPMPILLRVWVSQRNHLQLLWDNYMT